MVSPFQMIHVTQVHDETKPSSSKADIVSCSSHDSGNHSDSSAHRDLQLPTWSTTNEGTPLIDSPVSADSALPAIDSDKADKYSICSFHSIASTSSNSAPLCRICHIGQTTKKNPLIYPCRCSGSMLYVHRECLVHWLELSTRKMMPAPRCELCGYFYRRGRFLSVRRVHLPRAARRDHILNVLFLVVFTVMLISAGIALHFLSLEEYNTTARGYRIISSRLSQADIIVMASSVLFFFSFFVAVFTQYRAETSIFRMIFRFWVINRNWTIRNYDVESDVEALAARRLRSLTTTITTIARNSGKPTERV